MSVENKIRKIIRETINNIVEVETFEYDSAENMAVTNSQYTLPRRGIEPWFNYWDEVNAQEEDKEREEGGEPDQAVNFDEPRANYPSATVTTNMYESDDESFNASKNGPILNTGNYISPQPNPIQQPLDYQSVFPPAFINKGKTSDAMSKEIELFNNNIARDLFLTQRPSSSPDDSWLNYKPPANQSRSY